MASALSPDSVARPITNGKRPGERLVKDAPTEADAGWPVPSVVSKVLRLVARSVGWGGIRWLLAYRPTSSGMPSQT